MTLVWEIHIVMWYAPESEAALEGRMERAFEALMSGEDASTIRWLRSPGCCDAGCDCCWWSIVGGRADSWSPTTTSPNLLAADTLALLFTRATSTTSSSSLRGHFSLATASAFAAAPPPPFSQLASATATDGELLPPPLMLFAAPLAFLLLILGEFGAAPLFWSATNKHVQFSATVKLPTDARARRSLRALDCCNFSQLAEMSTTEKKQVRTNDQSSQGQPHLEHLNLKLLTSKAIKVCSLR